jgi:hypothetical protein
MEYTLEQFKGDVIQWSTERDIIKYGSIDGQQQKGREECGEVIMEIHNIIDNGRTPENLLELKKEVGDIAVIMINVDHMQQSRSDFYFLNPIPLVFDADYAGAAKAVSEIHTIIKLGIEDYSVIWDFLDGICVCLGIDLSECAYLAFKKIEHRKGKFCKESMSWVKES